VSPRFVVLFLLLVGLPALGRTPEPKKRPVKDEPPAEAPAPKDAPLDEHALVAVVEKNKLDMKVCYQRALRREPDLRLKMVTRVRIDGAGRVTTVSFADAAVAREDIGLCLSDAIKRWEFPEASKEYGFEFPIVLMRD
jgi:hypothetical protein